MTMPSDVFHIDGFTVPLWPEFTMEISGISTRCIGGMQMPFRVRVKPGTRREFRLRISPADARRLMLALQEKLEPAQVSVAAQEPNQDRSKVRDNNIEREPAEPGVPEEKPANPARQALEGAVREDLVTDVIRVKTVQEFRRCLAGNPGGHHGSADGEVTNESVNLLCVEHHIHFDGQLAPIVTQVHFAPLASQVNQLAGRHRRAPRFYPAGPGGSIPANEGRNG